MFSEFFSFVVSGCDLGFCLGEFCGHTDVSASLSLTFVPRVSQIQDISVETEDNKEKKSAKDALLLWCQMKTAG